MDAGACCRTCRGTGFAAINTLVSYAIRSMSFIFSKPPQHSQRPWESAVANTYACNALGMREIRQCVAPHCPRFLTRTTADIAAIGVKGKPERGRAFGPAIEQGGLSEVLVPFRPRPYC